MKAIKPAVCSAGILAVLIGTAPWGQAVAAEVPKAPMAEERVSLTVYNQNFAVVKEVRSLDVPAKIATVQFRDVAKQIDATSVAFKSLADPAGTTVLEQNYEFDLVSADKLLDKYIDKDLTVVTKQGKSYEGLLQSFDAGQLILRAKTGIVMVQRPASGRSRPQNCPPISDFLQDAVEGVCQIPGYVLGLKATSLNRRPPAAILPGGS